LPGRAPGGEDDRTYRWSGRRRVRLHGRPVRPVLGLRRRRPGGDRDHHRDLADQAARAAGRTSYREGCLMNHREVELLAVGAGPSNLALAIALEELAPDELATSSLLIEQHSDTIWQRGMLMPWT